MAEDITRLLREIERIIAAPYVPSLQDLYNIVHHVDASKIKIWSLQKPCQVGLLADILVESLSRSRVALPLLSSFATTTCFRDALLHRHPVVLDTFLEKTVDSGDPEYTAVCVSMLSSPLPPTVVPPGRLASFIAKLVSGLASNPCAETVAPLHKLMSTLNGSPGIIREIPEEIMSSLQVEFTKTLRNMEDHMGILMSLATFARIASTQSDPQNLPQQHGSEPPNWLLNIRHFFGSKRGQKTLDLVVLRVILACSSNTGSLTPSQAADSIRLAVSIVDQIDASQKDAWVASGSSKIAKLCDKVVRDGLDREVQLMGLTFLLSICPVVNFPPQIRNLGLRLLVSKDSRTALTTMEPQLVIRLTQYLATCDESMVYELLRFTVDAVKDNNPNRASISNLHVAILLFSSFQRAEPQVISSLLGSTSTKETIASLFGKFPVQPSQTRCEGSEICYCAYGELQNKLLRSLFEMYFAAALSHNENHRDIDILKSFLDRAPLALGTCSFANAEATNFRSPLLLRDRREFSLPEHPTRDWRSQITDTFMQSSRTTHDSMLRKVEDICFDLERRCYDVEGPLRSAEEDRNKQMHEVEKLQHENESLQQNGRKSAQVISDLRQEIARLEEQAECACNRIEDLSASLNSAHDELQQKMIQSEESLHMEKEKSRSRELDLMAISTEKDDQLEELQEELRRVQSENGRMRTLLDTEAQQKTSHSEEVALLHRNFQEQKMISDQHKALCSQQEDEIQRLSAAREELEMETENMKTMLEGHKQETERLYNSLQKAEDTSKLETEAMRQKHKTEISDSRTEVTKLQEENARLHREMQDAASQATQKLQIKDKRMQHLEKKVQSMRDEREAKAREFSEAQQHIGRLMGVMGFSAQPAQPTEPKPQQAKNLKHSKLAARHSDAFNDEDSQLVESFESMPSNFNEPTPKRPRGNRLSQTMASKPRTPGIPASKSSPHISETTRRSARKPLADADFNSPNKSPTAGSLKHNQPTVGPADNFEDNCLQDLDLDMDLEFSRDFLFTSTAFSGSDDKSARQ